MMLRRTNTPPSERRRNDDAGSILPMVLVFTVIGSIVVLGLLNFAVTIFRTQPVLTERDDTFQTARSGMEVAIVLQREVGPGACFTETKPSTFPLNGYDVNVQCSLAGSYFGSARNQLGIITTSTDPTIALTGPGVARTTGAVFIDGGPSDDGRDWFDLVGEDPEGDDTHVYPNLPPIPAYVRGTVNPPTIGSCNLYFPGRYIEPLVLDGGQHYFASGVYYFEQPVTMTGDARVVGGQGPTGGCAGGDAPAAGSSQAPSDPSITGRGVTFLFGDEGRLEVTGARLAMNRRVSDASTRGSEGIAIRTINFGQSPVPAAAPDPDAVVDPDAVIAAPLTVIPADIVFLGSTYTAENPSCNAALSTVQCLQRVADHEVRFIAFEPGARYTTSGLTRDDVAVLIDQGSGSSASNGVVIDGNILTPNSAVMVADDTNPNHQMRLNAGVVADSLTLGDQSPAANYVVGMIDQAIQRRFALTVQVAGPNGGSARSEALLDVKDNGNYAIYAWSVDASR